MAVGDAADLLARGGLTLPPWFGDAPPHVQAVLAGWAAEHGNLYDTIGYAALQERLASVSDGWADAAAWDFFGSRLLRKGGEGDAALRLRVRKEVLRPRVTRVAVLNAVADLTGRPSAAFEPARPADTGGYDTGAMGYDMGGTIWGALDMPCQAFVIAFRPSGAGLPNVAGYDTGVAGYMPGGGGTAWSSLDDELPHVTDADIYAAITDTMPAGSVAWTAILS